MGLFSDIKSGVRSVIEASRVVSSFGSLWLWLYTSVTLLGAAIMLPPTLVATTSIGNDPYLWSGRFLPWVEPLVFDAKEHSWLGVGSLVVMILSWVFGLVVAAGIAGAISWRRSMDQSTAPPNDKKARGPFGSAGLRFFGTAFFYHFMIDLCVMLAAFFVWLVFRYGSPWMGLGAIALGVAWVGLLFFWRALALCIRVRGVGFWRTFSRSIGLIFRNPAKLIGAFLPLFVNAILLGLGLWFLLRYSFSGGILLFLLQQSWVLAYIGHKLLLQATADVWAFPEVKGEG